MAERKPVALDVVGRVMVEMGGDSARIDARGDRIVIQLPNPKAGARWAKGVLRRASLRQVHDALTAASLTLEVVIGHSTVGLLGIEARPNLASRILGFGPLEIRVRGLLGSLGKPSADRPE